MNAADLSNTQEFAIQIATLCVGLVVSGLVPYMIKKNTDQHKNASTERQEQETQLIGFRTTLNKISERQLEIKDDVVGIKTDIIGVKDDILAVKEDVTSLKHLQSDDRKDISKILKGK